MTRALAGPLVKARATSGGVGALGPDTGEKQGRLGHEAARLRDAAGYVAPTTAADAREPCSPTSGSPHSCTRAARCCQRAASVGERQVLDVVRSGVRGADEEEDRHSRGGDTRRGTARRNRPRGTGSRSSRPRAACRRRAARGKPPHRHARWSRCRLASRRAGRGGPPNGRSRTRPRGRACHRGRAPRRTRTGA